MKAKVPRLTSDEAAECLLEADLSELDFAQFRPAGFEFDAESQRVNMRLPKALLSAVKQAAAQRGMPYQRFIRQTLERAVSSEQMPTDGLSQ